VSERTEEVVSHASNPSAEHLVEASSANYETRDPKTLKPHPAHERLPQKPEALEALRESIRREKRVRVPLVATRAGLVLAGASRLAAALELNLPLVPVEIRDDLEDEDAQLAFIVDDNLSRKHYTEVERVRLAELSRQAEERLAAKRRAEAPQEWKGTGGPPERSGKSAGSSGEVRDILAKKVEMSPRTYGKAAKLLQGSEDGSAPIGKLYEHEYVSPDLGDKARRKLHKATQEDIVTLVLAAPEGQRRALASREIAKRLPEKAARGRLTTPVERDELPPEPPEGEGAPLKADERPLPTTDGAWFISHQVAEGLSQAVREWKRLTSMTDWKLDSDRVQQLRVLLPEAEAMISDLHTWVEDASRCGA